MCQEPPCCCGRKPALRTRKSLRAEALAEDVKAPPGLDCAPEARLRAEARAEDEEVAAG
ncbi:MAG: hypothetical protein KatS3mg058_3815 [Roseiflexus sp.]|nr:MAG: hypothetical protein KatS3mg058_3815 [Roseiflexus sp.]